MAQLSGRFLHLLVLQSTGAFFARMFALIRKETEYQQVLNLNFMAKIPNRSPSAFHINEHLLHQHT